MSLTLMILCALAPIGAIDVLYYHLYRFRLFERDQSVLEEVTHLVRHASFVAIVALLASGVRTGIVDHALLALLALDLVNSAADVWLEQRSRASLGGLPRGEYLLHFLGTFGTGLATASYLYERQTLPLAPAEGLLAWQSAGLVSTGVVLFLVESSLFVRARLGQRGLVARDRLALRS